MLTQFFDPGMVGAARSGQIFGESPVAISRMMSDAQEKLERGEVLDTQELLSTLLGSIGSIERGITTSMSGFPVRENLEAVAKSLIPTDTPLRNLIPRVKGAGVAAAWKQKITLGGGWGTSYDQPGGGASANQVFFGETGAPEEVTTAYANKSASYKLLGQMRSVTAFAASAGATYMEQIAEEKTNGLMNLMLHEENAILNGSATATAKPWGDGTNAFGFDGLGSLITTGNGTPSAQIQTTVGALTLAHINQQLTRIWVQGGREMFMVVNQQEALSLRKLAETSATIRVIATGAENASTLGVLVSGYVHPISGEIVKVIASRFCPAGTMYFGSLKLADGQNAIEMDVLPVSELPMEFAMSRDIQGYAVQALSPAAGSPLVNPFLVFVMEVLKMKGATVFGKSSGVTAA